jgi:UDPglucose 6-dehydrogenase
MVSPVLVDLRNIYLPEEIARHGFVYESVGRARGGGLNPARRASDKHVR